MLGGHQNTVGTVLCNPVDPQVVSGAHMHAQGIRQGAAPVYAEPTAGRACGLTGAAFRLLIFHNNICILHCTPRMVYEHVNVPSWYKLTSLQAVYCIDGIANPNHLQA